MWHSLYTDKFLKATVLVFLLSVIAAIGFETPLLLIVPFVLLALPFVFEQVIYKPGNMFWLLMITLPLSTEINFTPSLGIDFPDELLMMMLTGVFLIKLIFNKSLLSKDIVQHPIFSLLLLHLLWILISVVFSVDPALSFKYFSCKSLVYCSICLAAPVKSLPTKGRSEKRGGWGFAFQGSRGGDPKF